MRSKLVIMISGSGTNLQALIDAIANGRLPAVITGVISNRKQAYGLARAKEANIPTSYFPLKPYKDAGQTREQYDTDLATHVAAYTPDLIVLAGWMHILSPAFLRPFSGRVINLHPALPGQFVGTQAIERAYAAWQRGELTHSGCMVHYAIPEVDAGEVIATQPVPIYPTDKLDDFTARMHETEHELIVTATDRALLQQTGITTENIAARIRAARARWAEALADIPPDYWTIPITTDGWSVKDSIAHLTWYEREIATMIQQRALAGSDLWLLPQAAQNDAIFQENRERPLADIQAEAAQIFTQLLAAVDTLTGADWVNASHFAEMPPKWIPWHLIAENTYEHYEAHIPLIQAWSKRIHEAGNGRSLDML